MSALDPFDERNLERLLERAEQDPVLSEQLDFQADLVAAAELRRAELVPASAPRGTSSRRRRVLWLAAAALLVLSASAALWFRPWFLGGDGSAGARLLAARDAPRYVTAELRSPDEPQEVFSRTMEPYVRGAWPQAARQLETFLQEHPEHGPARFYLAAATEQLGDLASAEADYLRVAAVSDTLLAQHARLRLALLWLTRGEIERARGALEALQEEGGELDGTAREWLGGAWFR